MAEVDVVSIFVLLSLDDSLVATLAMSAPIVDELLVSDVVSATVEDVSLTVLLVSLVSLVGDLAVDDLLVAEEAAPAVCPLPDLPED